MPDRVILPNNEETRDIVVIWVDNQCYEFVGNTNDPLTELPEDFNLSQHDYNNCLACDAFDGISYGVHTLQEDAVEHTALCETDAAVTECQPCYDNSDPSTSCSGKDINLLDDGPVWVTGLFGYALDMTFGFGTTPSGNRAEIEDVDFAELHGTNGEFTYESVIKFSSVDPSNFTVPRQVLSMNNGDVQWYFVNEGGKIVMKLSNSNKTVTQEVPTTGAHAVNTSDWFYIAAVYNPSVGNIQFYWTRNPEVNQTWPATLGAATPFAGHDSFVSQKLIFGNREGADENFLGLMEGTRISDTARCPKQVIVPPPVNGTAAKFDNICGCYELTGTITGKTVRTSNRLPIITYDTLAECLNPSPSPAAITPSPGQEPAGPVPTVVTPSPSPAVDLLPVPDVAPVSPSPEVIISSPASRIYRQITSPSPSATPVETVCCEIDCGGDPSMQVTISGGTWPDFPSLSPGVHCLCPTTYSNGANSETWIYGTNTPDDGIVFRVTPTLSQGFINIDYVNDNTQFTTGITSRVQDRLFTSYTAGSITATFQRGCNW